MSMKKIKKRKAKRPKFVEYESFEGPGLKMERLGSTVTFKTSRTAEEQRRMNEHLQNLHESLPGTIMQKATQLAKLFSELNTFDLLAFLTLSNFLIDPDTYVEVEHTGSSLIVEYATLLLLKEPYRSGERFIGPSDLDQITTGLKSIQDDLMWLHMTRSADPDRTGKPSELEELQVAIQLHELGVRNPGYDHHRETILEGLFGPYARTLVDLLGFDVTSALKITAAMVSLTSERMKGRMDEAAAKGRELSQAVGRSRKGHPPPPHLQGLVSELDSLPKKEADERIHGTLYAWVFTLAGDAMSFDADDVCDATALPRETVMKFLYHFSLAFGDIPAAFYVPEATHPLKLKPLVRHDERYMYPAPGLLDWALQPAFEAVLRETQGWDRYVAHRHRFVVNEAVRLLKAALPSAEANSELEYSVGGESLDAELDALLQVDSAAIFMEGKAGAFTAPAKEGKARRLQRDLGSLVTKAHEQVIRAAEYFDSGDMVVVFRPRQGGEVMIDRSTISALYLVSVVLEPIGHLVSLLRSDSLFLPRGDRYVWTVSLYDLMVISELAEPFPMLLHYIIRRVIAIRRGLVRSHDELDLFGHYLARGLYFERDNEQGMDLLTVGTFTDMFDAYYMHKAGPRRKYTKKPTQRMPPEFRAFLDALGNSGIARRLDMLIHLLDMGEEARKIWMRGVVEVKRRFRRDGRLHNYSQVREEGGAFGITYMCGPEEEILPEVVEGYCRRKMEELKATKWLALADRRRGLDYEFQFVIALGELSLLSEG